MQNAESGRRNWKSFREDKGQNFEVMKHLF
jgi:hypothetical protein